MLLSLLILMNCNTREKAANYKENIELQIDLVLDHAFEIENAFDNRDWQAADSALNEMLSKTKSGRKELETLGVFKSQDELHQSSLELMDFYESFAQKRYLRLVELMKKDSVVPVETDEMYNIINDFYVEEKPWNDTFQVRIQAYVLKYKLAPKEN